MVFLTGTSKYAKRRAKEKEKERQGTLAQRTAPGEVRVLNRGGAQPAAGVRRLPSCHACVISRRAVLLLEQGECTWSVTEVIL